MILRLLWRRQPRICNHFCTGSQSNWFWQSKRLAAKHLRCLEVCRFRLGWLLLQVKLQRTWRRSLHRSEKTKRKISIVQSRNLNSRVVVDLLQRTWIGGTHTRYKFFRRWACVRIGWFTQCFLFGPTIAEECNSEFRFFHRLFGGPFVRDEAKRKDLWKRKQQFTSVGEFGKQAENDAQNR